MVDGWSNPLGETWTEPPLLSLAEPALGGEAVREYDFDGRWSRHLVGGWPGPSPG